MEKWKQIKKFPGYEVSNLGNIRKDGKIIKPGIDKYGYPRVYFSLNNSLKTVTVHRLVAETWISNREGKPQVNHKDGDKTNNKIENLEWCSVQENIIHSFENQLNNNTNPVVVLDLETNTIDNFRSIKSLGKHLGISPSVLVPLIKYSRDNPVLSRYVVELANEEALVEKANTINFGREIYIYDYLADIVTKYPSVLIAGYATALRCLSTFRDYKHLDNLGYSVSFDATSLKFKFITSKNDIVKNRQNYVLTPYRKREFTYYLYDYFNKKEYQFSEIFEIVDFINERLEKDMHPVDNSTVSEHLGRVRRDNVSGLIRGFGIKSSRENLPWKSYSENVVLCNKYTKWTTMVYKVSLNGCDNLVFGPTELKKLFPHYSFSKYTSGKDVVDFVNNLGNPNIHVEILDRILTVS